MTETCDVFGCLRTRVKPEVEVTAIVEYEIVEYEIVKLKVCEYHKDFFEMMDPSLYNIGFTFRHEVEIRLVPATPAP